MLYKEKQIVLKSHLCVGLDIVPELLPKKYNGSEKGILDFIESVIENTKDIVGAYKINLAFFEAMGSKGYKILEKLLPKIHNDIIKIGDAKRGDISSSSKMYAKSLFDHFGFDSVTLNPFMGLDSLEPFLSYENKLNFILCLTSNPGAVDFQKVKLNNNKFLFEESLEKFKKWNSKYKNVGIVFGGTQKEEFSFLKKKYNDLHILIPGIGAQGGDLDFVVNYLKKIGMGKFLINSSRGILYSNNDSNNVDNIRKRAFELNEKIKYLNS